MSFVAAAASELIAPECVLIVAATIAATIRPSSPAGMCSTMNVGKIASVASKCRRLVKAPRARAPITRNSVNCTNTAKPLPMIARCASRRMRAREQALHDQLVGAVRCHREERAAEQPREQRVRAVEPEVRIDRVQLARAAARCDRSRPAAGHGVAEQHDRHDAAEHVDARLHELRPHHGLHSAAIRVDDREQCRE